MSCIIDNFKRLTEPYHTLLRDDLKAWVAIPSVRNEQTATEAAPFGAAIGEALEYVLYMAQRDGFQSTSIDGHAVRITWEGQEKDAIIGVLVHADVVPASSNWDAFTLKETEDRFIGRGTSDDKGPALAAYYAMRALKDAGFTPKKTIHFIVGGDEESHWQCMTRYFKTEPMPSFAFSPDADFPLIYGEKGIADITLEGPGLSGAIRAFHAGSRSNVVPDEATAQLDENWAKEHAFESTQFVMQGQAAHAMEPQKGRNAATGLAHQLHTLDASLALPIQALAHLHNDPFGTFLGCAIEHEEMGALTQNVGIVEMNERSSRIVLNLRYPKNTTIQKIATAIEDAMAPYHLRIASIENKDPHYVDPSIPEVQTLLSVYHTETENNDTPKCIGGGTYARVIPNGVAFGPLFPASPSTAHQSHEYILKHDLWQAMAIYAHALYRLCK